MKKIIIPIIVIILAAAGWLLFFKQNDNTQNQSASTSTSTGSTIKDGKLTADDVAQHDSADDCWTIIRGDVYDITSYIKQHPGGSVITQACGVDGTTAFNTQGGEGSHSPTAEELLKSFKVGTLSN